MKKATLSRGYWYARLQEYERAREWLLREDMSDEDRAALERVHVILRKRAWGEEA